MLTLQDIADEADVSIATVSNVVNGNLSKVSGENVVHIRELIEKLSYAHGMWTGLSLSERPDPYVR